MSEHMNAEERAKLVEEARRKLEALRYSRRGPIVYDEYRTLADALAASEKERQAAEEALRRMVEHTPLDTLSYEQVRELGRAALSSPAHEKETEA